jgi:hypothetical protein
MAARRARRPTWILLESFDPRNFAVAPFSTDSLDLPLSFILFPFVGEFGLALICCAKAD